MTKDDIARGLVEAAQTKLGAGSLTTGTTGMMTAFIEGVTPYIPFTLAVLTVIFGVAHIWLHWKEVKIKERMANGSK